MILFLSLSILSYPAKSQSRTRTSSESLEYYKPLVSNSTLPGFDFNVGIDTVQSDTTSSLPDPKSVMYKSMIIPGWGQIVNKQVWKVPIVYGILGGLAWYSVRLNKQYHDYRAAYYNLNPNTPDDLRFGVTPSYIPSDANLQQIRSIRNTYRNRRDLVYVGIVLAYGLNIVDAYVFAHMRSFDVSEDLSMRTRIQPAIMTYNTPGVTLSIDLIKK